MINNHINEEIGRILRNNYHQRFVIDPESGKELSYGETLFLAKKYGEVLKQKGVSKGDTIIVSASNSLDLLLLYFATLLEGIKIVPVDPELGSRYLELIMTQTPFQLLVSENPNIQKCRSISLSQIKSEADRMSGEKEQNVFHQVDMSAAWLITFTSGTTGIPKGVIHSSRDLFLSAIAFAREFNFERHVFLHNLPMTYMAGILNLIFLPFVSGSCIVLGERFKVENLGRFWDLPVLYNVNVFWFTPTILSFLLRVSKNTNLNSNSEIIGCVGTAPLHFGLKKSFEEKFGIPLYESYGLTETLFVSTNSPKLQYFKNSVGKVLSGVDLSLNPEGEILVKTPWMFLGYLNFETERFFINGMFKTGDIGEIRNGYLWIRGRKKYIINKGGIKISPALIEEIISEKQLFKDFAIIGLPDDILGEKTVCAHVPLNDKPLAPEVKRNLNLEIREKLGRDFCIDMFVKVAIIPRTISGKVDMEKLKIICGEKNDSENKSRYNLDN